MTNYLGVSFPRKKNHFCFCLLDDDLNIRTAANGLIDEVLAYASAEDTNFAAVSAPSSINKGLMQKDEYRNRFSPPPLHGRWLNLRLAEYELVRDGAKITHTPDSLAACPDWIRKGFIFYHQLSLLGFQPFPKSESKRYWLEVPAEAAFFSILGQRLRSKSTLEGRIQRQLLLWKQGLNISDPMGAFEEITRYRLERGKFPFQDICSLEILQAVVIVFVVWLAGNHPEKVLTKGELSEGRISLPVQLIHD